MTTSSIIYRNYPPNFAGFPKSFLCGNNGGDRLSKIVFLSVCQNNPFKFQLNQGLIEIFGVLGLIPLNDLREKNHTRKKPCH